MSAPGSDASGRPAPDGARLVLATRNRHKVVELRAILSDALAEDGVDVDLDLDGARFNAPRRGCSGSG